MAQDVQRTHYRRFSPAQRFEHFVLIIAFIGLAITGLPQLFAGEAWAQSLILALGRIESVRILHRFMALLLIVEVLYHVLSLAYKLLVLRQSASMLPRRRDGRDLLDWLRYTVGRLPERPPMAHYNFLQKIDYWLTVLSILVLLVTGLLLWNPIAVTGVLPGGVIPVAQAIHKNQALLLVLLVVWHTYNAFLKQFNVSIFTGNLVRRIMLEEHAEELETLESGEQTPGASGEQVASRARRFWPVAIVVTVLVAAGLIRYLTYQQTAITTVPRQNVAIFAPDVQPAAGDAAIGGALWSTLRCPICHGPQATGGPEGAPALKGSSGSVGKTLTFEKFYAQVRNGSDKMPAFRPEELPDGYMAHLWAWLSSKSTS
jgi:formate dehydrogenase gamma subunit